MLAALLRLLFAHLTPGAKRDAGTTISKDLKFSGAVILKALLVVIADGRLACTDTHFDALCLPIFKLDRKKTR